MSIWISKAILVSLLVSGCVAPDAAGGLFTQSAGSASQQPKSLTASGLALAGPSGFCPLPGTRQQVSGAVFIAFAPCDGTAGAILTATVGAEGSASGIILTQASMTPYFQTAEGVAALRGAGNRDSIAVHEVRDYKDAVVLRLTRKTTVGESDSWRALMRLGGRLVTLTVRPRQGQKMALAEGRNKIQQFVTALRGANRT